MIDVRAVLQRTDVVALIGETVRLKKQGAQHYGICPLHSDRSPSLRVDGKKGLWLCPVCQVGGNAFDWVMQRDGSDFKTAGNLLERAAGIVSADGKRTSAPPIMEPQRPKFPRPRHEPSTPWGGQHLLSHEPDRPIRILNAFPGRAAYLRMTADVWPDEDLIWWPGDWCTADRMYLPPIVLRPLALQAGSLADDYRAQALLAAVEDWRRRYAGSHRAAAPTVRRTGGPVPSTTTAPAEEVNRMPVAPHSRQRDVAA